jgi:hypothetical protein
MRTQATLIDGIATVGFLLLAIPAATPSFADQQSSKVEQPHNVPGQSQQKQDRPIVQTPAAQEGAATADRMHGASEGASEGERNAASDQNKNTGTIRPDDTHDQGSRQK